MNIPIERLISTEPKSVDPGFNASLYQHEKETQLPPVVLTLREQGYTTGLSYSVIEHAASFPHRIWVVDNSGSMNQGDGHRIEATGQGREANIVSCTRWIEMQELVSYHVQMAALLQTPTIFRFLTDPGSSVGKQQFTVADKGPNAIQHDVRVAMDTMQKALPEGWSTPLTWHINEIRHSIQGILPDLMKEGKKIVMILATDGLPTSFQGGGGEHELNQFIQALKKLEGLPISVSVRLCTDDEEVCRFYNSIDEELSFSVEVVDDFLAEARNVNHHNRWVTYALPLQRFRELGFQNEIISHLSLRKLTKSEVAEFCALLLGKVETQSLPDAETNWNEFCLALRELLEKEQDQWNPVKKKMTPWINVQKLEEDYAAENHIAPQIRSMRKSIEHTNPQIRNIGKCFGEHAKLPQIKNLKKGLFSHFQS